jgi:hypothetical protein
MITSVELGRRTGRAAVRRRIARGPVATTPTHGVGTTIPSLDSDLKRILYISVLHALNFWMPTAVGRKNLVSATPVVRENSVGRYVASLSGRYS